MKILIIGYFGRSNLGDDLMLHNLISNIKIIHPLARISVVAHDCQLLPPLGDVDIIKSSDKLLYLISLFRANIVIWGGGTCFYDSGNAESNRGIRDLIRIGNLCRLFKTKLFFLGVGVGKITENVEENIKHIFSLSEKIYFRDEFSLIYGKKIIGNNAERSGDLALLLDVSEKQNDNKMYITYSGVYKYDLDLVWLSSILEYLSCKYNAEIAFLPCHRGVGDDNIHHKEVRSLLKSKSIVFDVNNYDEYIDVLSKSHFHIGVRLHSIVLADMLGVPNIGIEYSPKIKKYIESTGVISDARCVSSVNDIAFSAIDRVCTDYSKPIDYIRKENLMTIASIKDIFNELKTK